MTKNSLFTQFLRLSGMRPAVGEKGESVSARPQLHLPPKSCNAYNSTVCQCKRCEEKYPTFLVSGGCFSCPAVLGWRPVSHPHSQHLAFRGAAPLRVTFRTREELFCWSIVPPPWDLVLECCAVSAPLCGLAPVTGAAITASLSCSSQAQTPVSAHSLKK